MLARWEARWASSVRRWEALECVKVILPWSTPSMRFCTSELKTAVICRDLVRRFPGQAILSVSGVRRDESRQRSKVPAARPQPKLKNAKRKTSGLDWVPIADWSKEDVFSLLAEKDFDLHEAYTTFGSSRVSCAFCIMSTKSDLRAAASCADNADVYRSMVALEAKSSFAFQSDDWLADVAPQLLSPETQVAVAQAKRSAEVRQVAEARIAEGLLYCEGWPTRLPTAWEADQLADVRRIVASTLGLQPTFTDAASIIARFQELLDEKAAKGKTKVSL